jgi:hypothetical protein
MVMQWDPISAGFNWGAPPDQPDAGTIMGQYWPEAIGPGARYAKARQDVFPNLGQRPRLGRALDRALPFLYSNYLAGLSGADVGMETGIDPQGFGAWMLGNQAGDVFGATGSPAGVGATRWGGVGGMYGQLPGAYMPEGHDFRWSDLMQAARQGAPGEGGGGGDPRYWDLLQQAGAPEAFTRVATAPRPGMAGSVVANMQARAMARKRDAWNIERGGTGDDIDWLGYITGEAGLAREPYRTTPTTAVTVPPGTGGGDPTPIDDTPLDWITAWQIQILSQAEGADQIASVGRYLQQEKERRDTMSFADWQAYVSENPWDEKQTYLP